jgi:hypothetical protein
MNAMVIACGFWRSPAPLVAAGLLSLAGCSRPGSGRLPTNALHHAIAVRIGDPSTCVLIAERATGRVIYRYGESFNCVRGLPACDRPGTMSATQALSLAQTPGGRGASCPSVADGSRMVGWAEGRAASKSRDLIYSAVMEGQGALPGHEMSARLDEAFQWAGL